MSSIYWYEKGYQQLFSGVSDAERPIIWNKLNNLLRNCFGPTPGYDFTQDTNPLIIAINTQNEPIGTLNFEYIGDNQIFIYNVCVDSAYRGQKVGTQLFEYLMRILPPQYDYFELRVDWNNLPVIKFYTRMIFCDWYIKYDQLRLYGYRNRLCEPDRHNTLNHELQTALAVLNNIQAATDFDLVYKTFQKLLMPGKHIKYFRLSESDIQAIRFIEPTSTDCGISAFQIVKEIDAVAANAMRKLYCGVGMRYENILKYFRENYPQYKWAWINFSYPQETKLLQALLYIGLPREGAIFAYSTFPGKKLDHMIVLWKNKNDEIYVLDPQIKPGIHLANTYNFFGTFPARIDLMTYSSPPQPDIEVEMKDVDTVAETLFKKI